VDILKRDKDGKPEVVVGVDKSDPARAANVRMDLLGNTYFFAPANARALADTLRKYADAIEATPSS
jgi:hypothetical protein